MTEEPDTYNETRAALAKMFGGNVEVTDFSVDFCRLRHKETKAELTALDISLQTSPLGEGEVAILTTLTYVLERKDFISSAERAKYDRLYRIDLPQINRLVNTLHDKISVLEQDKAQHDTDKAAWGKAMTERSAELREARQRNLKNQDYIYKLEAERAELNILVNSLRARAQELSETVEQETKAPVVEAKRVARKAQRKIHKMTGALRYVNFAHQAEVKDLQEKLAAAEKEKAELTETVDFWKKYSRLVPDLDTTSGENAAAQEPVEVPVSKAVTIALSDIKDTTLNFYF